MNEKIVIVKLFKDVFLGHPPPHPKDFKNIGRY